MFIEKIKSSGISCKLNVPMSDYTTFRTGGTARIMLFPISMKQLFECATFSEDYVVLGLGSNVLVSDSGFDGIVINTQNLQKVSLKGCILECECGAKLSSINKLLLQNCLSGLEFTVGIPGTIGGLVAMNGGCFNKSISSYVCFVKALSGIYNANDCQFDYRSSRFLGDVIYSVGLKLKASESEIIEQKIEQFTSSRQTKQPKGNSCGSVFRNDGYFAGKIIDQAGLKGYRIGGAKISNEHANFIINSGGSSTDIYQLIQYIKKIVKNNLNVELHEEVRYIGKFE